MIHNTIEHALIPRIYPELYTRPKNYVKIDGLTMGSAEKALYTLTTTGALQFAANTEYSVHKYANPTTSNTTYMSLIIIGTGIEITPQDQTNDMYLDITEGNQQGLNLMIRHETVTTQTQSKTNHQPLANSYFPLIKGGRGRGGRNPPDYNIRSHYEQQSVKNDLQLAFQSPSTSLKAYVTPVTELEEIMVHSEEKEDYTEPTWSANMYDMLDNNEESEDYTCDILTIRNNETVNHNKSSSSAFNETSEQQQQVVIQKDVTQSQTIEQYNPISSQLTQMMSFLQDQGEKMDNINEKMTSEREDQQTFNKEIQKQLQKKKQKDNSEMQALQDNLMSKFQKMQEQMEANMNNKFNLMRAATHLIEPIVIRDIPVRGTEDMEIISDLICEEGTRTEEIGTITENYGDIASRADDNSLTIQTTKTKGQKNGVMTRNQKGEEKKSGDSDNKSATTVLSNV